jgi:hypothetical protein
MARAGLEPCARRIHETLLFPAYAVFARFCVLLGCPQIPPKFVSSGSLWGALLLGADRPATLLWNREPWGRGDRKLSRRSRRRRSLRGGRGHGHRLPGHTDRPQDDLDREKRAADRQPVGQILDPVAVRVEIRLDPDPGGPIGLGDVLYAPVSLSASRAFPRKANTSLCGSRIQIALVRHRTNGPSARIAKTSSEPWFALAPRNDPDIDAAATKVPARARNPPSARSCSAKASAFSW